MYFFFKKACQSLSCWIRLTSFRSATIIDVLINFATSLGQIQPCLLEDVIMLTTFYFLVLCTFNATVNTFNSKRSGLVPWSDKPVPRELNTIRPGFKRANIIAQPGQIHCLLLLFASHLSATIVLSSELSRVALPRCAIGAWLLVALNNSTFLTTYRPCLLHNSLFHGSGKGRWKG